MKNISIIILFLFSEILWAQNYKVLYQITWKPSVENDSTVSDIGALIINGNKSYFSGYDKFRSDSLKSKIVKDFFESNQQGNLRFPSTDKKSRFDKTIIKNTLSDSLIQEEKYFVNTFQIISICKLQWKLLNVTETIFNYQCKKASLNFGGRRWIAWYTTEIPISDGPYKFYGLPGLIIKISDESNEFIFEAKGVTKEQNDLEYRNFGMPNPTILSQKKWNSFYEKYKKQPSIIFENLNTETTTYVINGKEIGRDEKNSYDMSQKKYLLENNNEIEIKNECN